MSSPETLNVHIGTDDDGQYVELTWQEQGVPMTMRKPAKAVVVEDTRR